MHATFHAPTVRTWGYIAVLCCSFVCDELDGRFARMLNQMSTLGGVLDMVTDRQGPACSLREA